MRISQIIEPISKLRITALRTHVLWIVPALGKCIPTVVCACLKPEQDIVHPSQPKGRQSLTTISYFSESRTMRMASHLTQKNQLPSVIVCRAVIQSFKIGSITKLCCTLIIFACLASSSLRAEVFTLWPFGGSGGSTDPIAALDDRELWSESVVINGVKTKLGVGLVRQDLKNVFEILTRLYPDAEFHWNVNSFMIEQRDKGGRRQRILFIGFGQPPYPTMRFSMPLPEKFPDSMPWPKDFPLPPSASPERVMLFSERDAAYGEFKSAHPPHLALNDIAAGLQAYGWKAVGNEATGLDGRGEIFFRQSSREIAVVHVGADGSGGSRGAIYRRPLKK